MLRLLLLLLSAATLHAQPLRFEWKPGEAHKFRVTQNTTVTETLAGTTNVTAAKVTLSKTWMVRAVDGETATLELAITAMKQELTRPVAGKSETTVIDSATPEGAEAMKQYLNRTILTCTVDGRGRVSAVKALLPDGVSRLAAELPFRIELPADAVTKDSKWERPFVIQADAEKHDALQSVVVESIDGARTTFKVSASLKKSPAEVADWQPLLPWLWEGTVTWEKGRYLGTKLAVNREYPNHAGAGTKFAFASTLEEVRE